MDKKIINQKLEKLGCTIQCSRCKNDGELKYYLDRGKKKYYVQCPVCGNMGKDVNNVDMALVLWSIDNT